MSEDRWPNLRSMVRNYRYYSLESAQKEMKRALAVLDTHDELIEKLRIAEAEVVELRERLTPP